ncbi:hypothetical protein Aduo_001607 [Ancylostoma duodenale]
MDVAQAMLYLPCDPELVIFRVDSFTEMDWADALSLSMELDSFANLSQCCPVLLLLTAAGAVSHKSISYFCPAPAFHLRNFVSCPGRRRRPPIHSVERTYRRRQI